jgi:hypothetical protein
VTVYAASSVAAVTVSAAHKGCGQSHSRPERNGVPAKVWALDCEQCSEFLRQDPMWATSQAETPETFDERLERESFEKRGTLDRDQVLALAMAKIADAELPAAMQRPLRALPSPGVVIGALIECNAGHGSRPGSRFCVECGEPLNAPLRRACPDGHEVAAGMRFCGQCGQPAGTGGSAPALKAAG